MLFRVVLMVCFAGVAACLAGWEPGPLRELTQLPGGAAAWERDLTAGERTVRLSGVSFDEKHCQLSVIDNPPDARRDLREALVAAGAFAGCNGGYFHPDFTPLGLVVSGGDRLHAFERAKLLSGILASRKGRRIELKRAASFKDGPDVQDALQAGPWLIEAGEPVGGLSESRLARRTVVATNGRGRWAILAFSPVSLAGAAEILATEGTLPGWQATSALNLDGGSSTALTALADSQEPIAIPSFGSVRNYLAISPR